MLEHLCAETINELKKESLTEWQKYVRLLHEIIKMLLQHYLNLSQKYRDFYPRLKQLGLKLYVCTTKLFMVCVIDVSWCTENIV